MAAAAAAFVGEWRLRLWDCDQGFLGSETVREGRQRAESREAIWISLIQSRYRPESAGISLNRSVSAGRYSSIRPESAQIGPSQRKSGNEKKKKKNLTWHQLAGSGIAHRTPRQTPVRHPCSCVGAFQTLTGAKLNQLDRMSLLRLYLYRIRLNLYRKWFSTSTTSLSPILYHYNYPIIQYWCH